VGLDEFQKLPDERVTLGVIARAGGQAIEDQEGGDRLRLEFTKQILSKVRSVKVRRREQRVRRQPVSSQRAGDKPLRKAAGKFPEQFRLAAPGHPDQQNTGGGAAAEQAQAAQQFFLTLAQREIVGSSVRVELGQQRNMSAGVQNWIAAGSFRLRHGNRIRIFGKGRQSCDLVILKDSGLAQDPPEFRDPGSTPPLLRLLDEVQEQLPQRLIDTGKLQLPCRGGGLVQFRFQGLCGELGSDVFWRGRMTE